MLHDFDFAILITFNVRYSGSQILTMDHVTEHKMCTLCVFHTAKGALSPVIEMHEHFQWV
jgi:hypothetical protein